MALPYGFALRREWRLRRRRASESLLPLAFFLAAATAFPIAIGPDPTALRQVGPGVIWACALLTCVATVGHAFSVDAGDGVLEQCLISAVPLTAWVACKAVVHWLWTGLPLVLAAPLLGLMFDLGAASVALLAATLLLGTPVLSLLGLLGAALTVGLRAASSLVVLLVLPLALPVLVFGCLAVSALDAGLPATPHLSLLGALLLLAIVALPPTIAAALRTSLG